MKTPNETATIQPATHTPGAWIQETNDAGRQIRITDSATESRCIATVAIFGDADNSRANARLIAAAPDLLAALEGIANHLEQARAYFDGKVKDSGAVFASIGVARDALARAKGQA